MKRRFIRFIILWYALVIVLYLLLVFPIYSSIGYSYPFYLVMLYFVFFTGISVHLLFFLEYSEFFNNVYLKGVLIFLVPFILLLLIDNYIQFVGFGENFGYQSILQKLNPKQQLSLSNYIKNSTLFFAVVSIIGVSLIPIKMIRSIWRQRRKELLTN